MCTVKHKKKEFCTKKLLLNCGFITIIYIFISFTFYIQITIGKPQNDIELKHLSQSYAFVKKIKAPYQIKNPETNNTHEYFIYTSQCHMRYVDPFEKEALHIYHPVQYEKCANDEDIVSVEYDKELGGYRLQIQNKINGTERCPKCCYKEILRSSGKKADDKIEFGKCQHFDHNFLVPKFVNWMIVDCEEKGQTLQSLAFAFVHKKNEGSIMPKLNISETTSKPSILVLGIDSLSRSNFRRNMPLTFEFVRNNNWFELEGYNKMGDNTFPNLMALLTGYNDKQANEICLPKTVGGLGTCSFIWDHYKAHGYQTAYGEDFSSFATFNYLKQGFLNPPTDHYLRPLILGATKQLAQDKRQKHYCVGRKHSAEYVYDYAEQFATIYKDAPFFGFFWTNSFSHDEFDAPASMDETIRNYLQSLKSKGIMENSIIMLFSDHGMRYGKLRNLQSGFLEERLPLFQMFLPNWFQLAHPDYVKALSLNSHRLTSPYDIYSTFQHIINGNVPYPKPIGCETSQSVFLPIPENRTCKDAGISDHWCTCNAYYDISKRDPIVVDIVERTVYEINHYMTENFLQPPCLALNLRSIKEAQKKEKLANESFVIYRVKFEGKPSTPLFETTIVHYPINNDFKIDIDSISRINTYKGIAKCINHKKGKNFCICP